MDSTVINKEIRKMIWPMLKISGFSAFTARSAWRYTDCCIDVVNFQSFNSYLASGVGCTTFSFAVRLGIYFPVIQPQHPIKSKGEFLRPHEYECHFRRTLHKSINQPILPRTDTWFVDASGSNLSQVMDDAKQSIEKGLSWFERFQDFSEIYRILESDGEIEEIDAIFSLGKKSSPIRNFMAGYIALAMGQNVQAVIHLEAALASGCFDDMREVLSFDIASAQAAA